MEALLVLMLCALLGNDVKSITLGDDGNADSPRHRFDERCPGAVHYDPPPLMRDPSSSSSYLWNEMDESHHYYGSSKNVSATVKDCAAMCCHDWNCEAFAFYPSGTSLPMSPGGASKNCSGKVPCCVFKDDIDSLVNVTVPAVKGVVSGVRAKLAAIDPPFSLSTTLTATVDNHFVFGINGDEFPITWGADGNQYTGAGDNHQADTEESPLSFFQVRGKPQDLGCNNPPTHHDQPAPTCKGISMVGSNIPIKGASVSKICPNWHADIPNLKSSGVISIDGVLYWAVSCFNYGDDEVFNRQRYGPAFIVTSTDYGVTWNTSATPVDFFPNELAAPRFVQYGRNNAGATSNFVYVHFPGTSEGSAFFENNDQILLARVPQDSILTRNAYEFFTGLGADGAPSWAFDNTIAVPVFSYPLMTSVQQINFHTPTQRYLMPNWAWISYDGNPRPDHTGDERNDRTGHQRTQLTLFEADEPWGPFRLIYRTDDWRGSDGSTGAYTPVFPPAWMGETSVYMVSTQCCGNPRPPLNHYGFNVQRVDLHVKG